MNLELLALLSGILESRANTDRILPSNINKYNWLLPSEGETVELCRQKAFLPVKVKRRLNTNIYTVSRKSK